MKTFDIKIYDEQLLNGDDLRLFLDENAGRVSLTTCIEGPSLGYCGVLGILDEHCNRTGRDKDSIVITTPNIIEQYEYPKSKAVHSWWKACVGAFKRSASERIDLPRRKFACLIGRKNPARLAILYWMRQQDCLSSSMRDENYRPDKINTEAIRDWVDDYESFKKWIYNIDVPPLDAHAVIDQYRTKDIYLESWGEPQMAPLRFYHNFDIELVAETWTMGETFFPTEKTVRPILAGKPFISYAPMKFMKNLRNLGFKTYGDCWDESYDDYSGLERWKRIQALIQDLSNKNDYMEQALEIAEYNKNHALDPKREWV